MHTDEGLSLEENNERDGDDYDHYDTNVEQKVWYNDDSCYSHIIRTTKVFGLSVQYTVILCYKLYLVIATDARFKTMEPEYSEQKSVSKLQWVVQ